MEPRYTLHYAPDNASLIVRIVLIEMDLSYRTVLVDRRTRAQDSAAYRALNPGGLIPVLETPDGPIFETAAILLWLADRHGRMAPQIDSPDRAAFLKWLIFASNTLHADLRILFYAELYVGEEPQHLLTLRQTVKQRLQTHLRNLDAAIGSHEPGHCAPSVLDVYLVCLLRWMALYPATSERDWFRLSDYPSLLALCREMENRPSVQAACEIEGLGSDPFVCPQYATPSEGSAT